MTHVCVILNTYSLLILVMSVSCSSVVTAIFSFHTVLLLTVSIFKPNDKVSNLPIYLQIEKLKPDFYSKSQLLIDIYFLIFCVQLCSNFETSPEVSFVSIKFFSAGLLSNSVRAQTFLIHPRKLSKYPKTLYIAI